MKAEPIEITIDTKKVSEFISPIVSDLAEIVSLIPERDRHKAQQAADRICKLLRKTIKAE